MSKKQIALKTAIVLKSWRVLSLLQTQSCVNIIFDKLATWLSPGAVKPGVRRCYSSAKRGWPGDGLWSPQGAWRWSLLRRIGYCSWGPSMGVFTAWTSCLRSMLLSISSRAPGNGSESYQSWQDLFTMTTKMAL